jgi:hypothetical protein
MTDTSESYYLAHPIRDRLEIRQWELKVESELELILINPFYDLEREDIKELDAGITRVNDGALNYRELVERDLAAIRKSRGIVAILTQNVTVGSLMEVFYNAYVLGRPTYLIIEKEEFKKHPWLRYVADISSGAVYYSRQEFVDDFLKKRGRIAART